MIGFRVYLGLGVRVYQKALAGFKEKALNPKIPGFKT